MTHLIKQFEPRTEADRRKVIDAVQARHGGLSDHGAIIVWRRLDHETRRRYLGVDVDAAPQASEPEPAPHPAESDE